MTVTRQLPKLARQPPTTSSPHLRRALLGSMRQVTSASDNVAMELFLSLLQENVLDRRRSATRDERRLVIVTWMERT